MLQNNSRFETKRAHLYLNILAGDGDIPEENKTKYQCYLVYFVNK